MRLGDNDHMRDVLTREAELLESEGIDPAWPGFNAEGTMSETKPMPDPTKEQRDSPEFEAIWGVIKDWDINIPEFYDGYCGANGSHVALILNALSEPKR